MVNAPELDRRPRLDTLIHLDYEAQRDFMSVRPDPFLLRRLGLGIYREPGAYLKFWLGFIDPTMPEHARWLFRTDYVGSSADGAWLTCEQEAIDGLQGSRLKLHTELARLDGTVERTGARLKTNHGIERSPEWLLKCYQVLDTMLPKYVALLPENLNWAMLHELLYHTRAWREANGAEDMPRELLLRMHGLGPLLDDERGHWHMSLLVEDD
jgi:hypothetical protein